MNRLARLSLLCIPLSFMLLIRIRPGVLYLSALALCALFFKVLNTIVNARCWKHPDEIYEENPIQRMLVPRIGYWTAEAVQTILVLGVPFVVVFAFYGVELVVNWLVLPLAALAPTSMLLFVNDLRVVRLVERRLKEDK